MSTLDSFFERNKNYVKAQDVPKSVIKKYQGILPTEILEIWDKTGWGIYENGMIRFVNPDDYEEFLEYVDVYMEPTIVVGLTSFGDLLLWEGAKKQTLASNEGNRLKIINVRKGSSDILGSNMRIFFTRMLGDRDSMEMDFDAKLFDKLRGKLSVAPAFDECYGYVPAIALGGPAKIQNVKIVKVKEYLDIIGQAVGTIDG